MARLSTNECFVISSVHGTISRVAWLGARHVSTSTIRPEQARSNEGCAAASAVDAFDGSLTFAISKVRLRVLVLRLH